jgi:mannose-6-phosphate isomerase-like protein (cupin superfamily)
MKVVPKVWGEERWIVNLDYCGKQMLLKKGFRCSMHMHKRKDETFFITRGRMLFEIEGKTGRMRRKILGPGDRQHVPPGTWHRFTGITDTEFFEFSTTHADEDSYRRESSGKAPRDLKLPGAKKKAAKKKAARKKAGKR